MTSSTNKVYTMIHLDGLLTTITTDERIAASDIVSILETHKLDGYKKILSEANRTSFKFFIDVLNMLGWNNDINVDVNLADNKIAFYFLDKRVTLKSSVELAEMTDLSFLQILKIVATNKIEFIARDVVDIKSVTDRYNAFIQREKELNKKEAFHPLSFHPSSVN